MRDATYLDFTIDEYRRRYERPHVISLRVTGSLALRN